MSTPQQLLVPPGYYRHYKGRYYKVLGPARHSESPDEPLTLYQPLYGEYGLWVRPTAMFNEQVETDDGIKLRFTLDAEFVPTTEEINKMEKQL
jgi:hypothetical protein